MRGISLDALAIFAKRNKLLVFFFLSSLSFFFPLLSLDWRGTFNLDIKCLVR